MKALQATTKDDIREFVDIRRQWPAQLALGNFYAEGEQIVDRLLQSNFSIHSMLVTEGYFHRWSHKMDSAGKVWLANKKWMEEQTGRKLNQACLALAKVPEAPDFADLVRSDATVVALDRIDHAVNVGAILRNCAAFEATAVVLNPNDSIHPYSLRSVRASLGGVFAVPVFTTDDLPHFLQNMRHSHGFDLLAADPAGSTRIHQMNIGSKCCLILGNEHAGLSAAVQHLQPRRVSIPIAANVDSLNVAAAGAIFLHRIFEAKSFLRQQSQINP